MRQVFLASLSMIWLPGCVTGLTVCALSQTASAQPVVTILPDWMAGLEVCVRSLAASTPPVVLNLKNGDRISGQIISESTNEVVLSNAWLKAISIPTTEIASRQSETNAGAAAPGRHSHGQQPATATAKSGIKPAAKPANSWQGEARFGLDAIASTADQQNYSGHFQLVYARPYQSDPKKTFKNTFTLDGQYQRTDGQVAANQVSAQNKSDFDLGKNSYGYGLFGAGHDDVQQISFQYQAGPGVGVHLIRQKTFVLNLESGLNYQAQFWQNNSDLETLYLRLAEDFTWKFGTNLSLTENFALYPDLEHEAQFYDQFQSTLSYAFWKNLSINFTVLDNYNTEVAPGVDRNLFEFKSSLGVKF